MGLQKVC